jgi:hypothetical protein
MFDNQFVLIITYYFIIIKFLIDQLYFPIFIHLFTKYFKLYFNLFFHLQNHHFQFQIVMVLYHLLN